jgi:hypothetical protein
MMHPLRSPGSISHLQAAGLSLASPGAFGMGDLDRGRKRKHEQGPGSDSKDSKLGLGYPYLFREDSKDDGKSPTGYGSLAHSHSPNSPNSDLLKTPDFKRRMNSDSSFDMPNPHESPSPFSPFNKSGQPLSIAISNGQYGQHFGSFNHLSPGPQSMFVPPLPSPTDQAPPHMSSLSSKMIIPTDPAVASGDPLCSPGANPSHLSSLQVDEQGRYGRYIRTQQFVVDFDETPTAQGASTPSRLSSSLKLKVTSPRGSTSSGGGGGGGATAGSSSSGGGGPSNIAALLSLQSPDWQIPSPSGSSIRELMDFLTSPARSPRRSPRFQHPTMNYWPHSGGGGAHAAAKTLTPSASGTLAALTAQGASSSLSASKLQLQLRPRPSRSPNLIELADSCSTSPRMVVPEELSIMSTPSSRASTSSGGSSSLLTATAAGGLLSGRIGTRGQAQTLVSGGAVAAAGGAGAGGPSSATPPASGISPGTPPLDEDHPKRKVRKSLSYENGMPLLQPAVAAASGSTGTAVGGPVKVEAAAAAANGGARRSRHFDFQIPTVPTNTRNMKAKASGALSAGGAAAALVAVASGSSGFAAPAARGVSTPGGGGSSTRSSSGALVTPGSRAFVPPVLPSPCTTSGASTPSAFLA